jgi:hypothetical protein
LEREGRGRAHQHLDPNDAAAISPAQRRQPYGEQIKPFNVLNAVFVDPTERPPDDERIVLVAPYERDRDRLEQQEWINRVNGRAYRITTEPSGGRVRPGVVTVKTYGDTILEYATHAEPKRLDPDGKPCDRTTIGLLGRRPVAAAIVRHIGKESNRLEEAQAGLLDDTDEPLDRYDQQDLTVFRELAIPILRHLGIRETARRAGLGLGSVSAALSGRSVPRATAISRYLAVASGHATELLEAAGIQPAGSEEERLRRAIPLIS